VLILLPIIQNILTIDAFRVQTRQKFTSSSIVSIKIDVVNLSIQTAVGDDQVNVVNVFSMLMLIFFLDHVGLIEFPQGVVK
jgi:hypothetical protein